MLFDYDDTDINSIFEYAKKLEGMTFQQVMMQPQTIQVHMM